MRDMTQEQVLAYAEVVAELDAYGALKRNRDGLIRSAVAAKVPKSEIARRMGIGRSTIDSVVGTNSTKEA